jgi:DtxR family Mn-dependent transcriptional regulator
MDINIAGQLSASLEDYLEAIFQLVSSKGAARTRDIARKLGVKAASVTGALRTLADKRYINYQPYEAVTLTSAGMEQARKIIRRHEVLRDFFVNVLGIKERIAEEGACKLEHGIPKQILDRLIEFVEFTETCPRGGKDWIENFIHQCNTSKERNCSLCIEANSRKFKEGKMTESTNQEITLADLKPKDKALVIKISKRGPVTKRLADMGVGRGALVEVERIAPLGDPIEIKVRGYHLSVRKSEAENIEVERK